MNGNVSRLEVMVLTLNSPSSSMLLLLVDGMALKLLELVLSSILIFFAELGTTCS